MKKLDCGIYWIRNIITNVRYIGQSINLKKRKRVHWSLLKNNKHWNVHLQRSFNKHGKENFIFETLFYCESFELTKYEQIFVNKYKKKNLLYNICLECVDSPKGIKVSPETRKKMSENHWNNSGENNYFYGKRGKNNPNTIKKETILQIIDMMNNEIHLNKIAKVLNISLCIVYKVRSGYYDKIYNFRRVYHYITCKLGYNDGGGGLWENGYNMEYPQW